MNVNKINGIQAINTTHARNISKVTKAVPVPKAPPMEYVKEDYNPFKLIAEIFKDIVKKKA